MNNKQEQKQQVDSPQNPSQEVKQKPEEEKKVLPQQRQIIISTDGNNATLTRADVAGHFELIGILEAIISMVKGTNK